MKIKQLIQELQEIEEEHGNLEIKGPKENQLLDVIPVKEDRTKEWAVIRITH